MAQKDFLGIAAAVAKVETITVGGTPAAGHVFSVTMNSKTVSYTASGAESTSTVASGLQAALNASLHPEFLRIAWTVNSNVITATSNTRGDDFDFTVTASADPTSTLTKATTVANAGPNDWRTAANWSGGTVPVNNDDVTIRRGWIKYGLSQASLQLASLSILEDAMIGLPDDVAPTDSTNPLTGYPEYLDRFLSIGANTVTINSSSSMVRLNVQETSQAAKITVTATGSGTNGPAVELQTNAAFAHNLYVHGGSVAVATGYNEAANLGNVYASGVATSLRLGAGVTGSLTIETHRAALVFECAATTVRTIGGSVSRYGTGTVTTWLNIGSTTDDYGTGTVTILHNSGRHNFRTTQARTYTDIVVYPWSRTIDFGTSLTVTNSIYLQMCHLADNVNNDPGPAPCWVVVGANVDVLTPTASAVPAPL